MKSLQSYINEAGSNGLTLIQFERKVILDGFPEFKDDTSSIIYRPTIQLIDEHSQGGPVTIKNVSGFSIYVNFTLGDAIRILRSPKDVKVQVRFVGSKSKIGEELNSIDDLTFEHAHTYIFDTIYERIKNVIESHGYQMDYKVEDYIRKEIEF